MPASLGQRIRRGRVLLSLRDPEVAVPGRLPCRLHTRALAALRLMIGLAEQRVVWPLPSGGEGEGRALEPLAPWVPLLARQDPDFARRMALVEILSTRAGVGHGSAPGLGAGGMTQREHLLAMLERVAEALGDDPVQVVFVGGLAASFQASSGH